MQPLRGNVKVDATVVGGHREAGLGAQERLVLHADPVLAGNIRGVIDADAEDVVRANNVIRELRRGGKLRGQIDSRRVLRE